MTNTTAATALLLVNVIAIVARMCRTVHEPATYMRLHPPLDEPGLTNDKRGICLPVVGCHHAEIVLQGRAPKVDVIDLGLLNNATAKWAYSIKVSISVLYQWMSRPTLLGCCG